VTLQLLTVWGNRPPKWHTQDAIAYIQPVQLLVVHQF
jgi:hypothetical protein